jgi:thioredoxin 1
MRLRSVACIVWAHVFKKRSKLCNQKKRWMPILIMNPAMQPYLSELEAPSRADVDALPGLTLLEFGTGWCGHCRAAQPALAEALAQVQAVGHWRHLKVEDGPGQALGRSFRVKLWPTLVLLRDGQDVGRLVRPLLASDIVAAMEAA